MELFQQDHEAFNLRKRVDKILEDAKLMEAQDYLRAYIFLMHKTTEEVKHYVELHTKETVKLKRTLRELNKTLIAINKTLQQIQKDNELLLPVIKDRIERVQKAVVEEIPKLLQDGKK